MRILVGTLYYTRCGSDHGTVLQGCLLGAHSRLLEQLVTDGNAPLASLGKPHVDESSSGKTLMIVGVVVAPYDATDAKFSPLQPHSVRVTSLSRSDYLVLT
jgi:hypothetical protein